MACPRPGAGLSSPWCGLVLALVRACPRPGAGLSSPWCGLVLALGGVVALLRSPSHLALDDCPAPVKLPIEKSNNYKNINQLNASRIRK